jgi:hypothetical protein
MRAVLREENVLHRSEKWQAIETPVPNSNIREEKEDLNCSAREARQEK